MKIPKLRTLSRRQQIVIAIIGALLLGLLIEGVLFMYLSYISIAEGFTTHISGEPVITLNQGEATTLEFELGVMNAPFCDAMCNWTLIEHPYTTVLASGTLDMSKTTHSTITYPVQTPASQITSIPYQFIATCQNKNELRCKQDNSLVSATTTIVQTTYPQQKQTIREQLESTSLDGTENTVSQLLAIATIEDSRITDITSQAARQALQIDNSVTRARKHILDEEYEQALTELTRTHDTSAIDNYEQARITETQITNTYNNLPPLNDTIIFAQDPLSLEFPDFSNTPLDESLTQLEQIQEQINQAHPRGVQISKEEFLNEAARLERQACKQFNTTCRPASCQQLITFDTRYTNHTVDGLEALEQACRRNIPQIIPPQQKLQASPTYNYTIQPLVFTQPVCCGTTSCGACVSQLPILFIHGHSFSESARPEFSLQAFNQLALGLQPYGRLYGGQTFAQVYQPTTIPGGSSYTSTYYFDTYAEEGEINFVPRTSESLESYALRLKESIDGTLQRSGRDQVILVTHSMGGLVSRRYLQIFGEEDVQALIMIATPNQGISGRTQRICPIIGSDRECEDMQENSLFMKKLQAEPPSIPAFTIAGVGCNDQAYDGVFYEETVQVDWAKHYTVNGTCPSTLELLHVRMLRPDEYPETTLLVKGIIDQLAYFERS